MGEEGRVVEKVADKTVESHGEKVPDGKPPVHIGRCEYETTQMPTGPPKTTFAYLTAFSCRSSTRIKA